MDRHDKAAEATFLLKIPGFRSVAAAIITEMMLDRHERILRLVPCCPGAVIEYDRKTERLVFNEDYCFVIAKRRPNRWWRQ